MALNFGVSILDLDEIPVDECKHLPLICLRTIISENTSLSVIITCLKWTSNYDFCVRVPAYPLGAPNLSKQIDLDDHHPLLRPLTDALNLYEDLTESHLKAYQLEFLEELIEYLDLKFS